MNQKSRQRASWAAVQPSAWEARSAAALRGSGLRGARVRRPARVRGFVPAVGLRRGIRAVGKLADVARAIEHAEAYAGHPDREGQHREPEQRRAPADLPDREGGGRCDQDRTGGSAHVRDAEGAPAQAREPVGHRRRRRHRPEHRHPDRAADAEAEADLPELSGLGHRGERAGQHDRPRRHHAADAPAIELAPDERHREVHHQAEDADPDVELGRRRPELRGQRGREDADATERESDRDRLGQDRGATDAPAGERGMGSGAHALGAGLLQPTLP